MRNCCKFINRLPSALPVIRTGGLLYRPVCLASFSSPEERLVTRLIAKRWESYLPQLHSKIRASSVHNQSQYKRLCKHCRLPPSAKVRRTLCSTLLWSPGSFRYIVAELTSLRQMMHVHVLRRTGILTAHLSRSSMSKRIVVFDPELQSGTLLVKGALLFI